MTSVPHSGAKSVTPGGSVAGGAVTLSNGPALWSAILAKMPQGSVIAGGAVRDYLLGIEPKDIDVFCPSSALGSFDFTGFEPLGSDRADEYAAMSIIDVVQRTRLQGVQVDLVGVCLPEWSPRALVDTFDFGITRCWFDGDLHDTDEAVYDRTHRVVTLLLSGRPERAAERFTRFNAAHNGRFSYQSIAKATAGETRNAEPIHRRDGDAEGDGVDQS